MRKIGLALAIGLLATTAAFVPTTLAASVPQVKVVIVVGATGSTTSSYRSDANSIAASFARYTGNITKVYSPNATWAAVKAAAVGANFVVYLGHGSGYPNPYNGTLQPNGDNGMGLNRTAGAGDSNTTYYGENYMATLALAPNAVVFLNHLCYASGDNEWGKGKPSLSTAKTRIDGYASGFIRGGARAVIAEGLGDLDSYITDIFTKHTTIDAVWKAAPTFQNHVSSWESTRNPGFTSEMDPEIDHPEADGDIYYRSMVSIPTLSTDSIVGPPPVIPSWIARDGGTDRFGTAMRVAEATFKAPVDVAYIANAFNFPDALAGAAAAGTVKGPVLLAAASLPLNASTIEALNTVKPKRIVVLGSAGALSDAVLNELHKYTAGAVDRYGGTDRFGTSAVISTNTFKTVPVQVAYIANAFNFPDALAGAAAAGTVPGPVLLVDKTGFLNAAVAAELVRLNPAKVVVLGGPVSVPDYTVYAIENLFPSR